MASLSAEDIAELEQTTRFTKREIIAFCKYGARIDRAAFGKICDACGWASLEDDDDEQKTKTSVCMHARLFAAFDTDGGGCISVKELVANLSKLTRGTLVDLSEVFFKMYDLNGDKSLDADEVIAVYNAMRKGIRKRDLTPSQCDRIRYFVRHADTDGDKQLSVEEFTAAVQKLAEADGAEEKARGGIRAFCNLRNIWLTFITSFFEIGTSLCLPASGALAARLMYRFEVQDGEIGSLVGFYYAGSMIGPLFGGQLLTRIGPARTIIIANALVGIGALLQALANGPDWWWLICAARFIIGFGGLITPFCTIEVLERLFPDHFMFIVGFRNLIQSASGFSAFLILPALADAFGPLDGPLLALNATNATVVNTTTNTDLQGHTVASNNGTGIALWFCFACAIASLVSNILVWLVHLPKDGAPVEDDASLVTKIRSLAGKIRPAAPGRCADWRLPLSFYLSTFGIQAQYFAPFSFSAFSVKIFEQKFNMTAKDASFLSGFMNLVGGFLGPVCGPLSDWLGLRAASLSVFGLFSVVGFIILATTEGSPGLAWLATMLFALTYGFGDTVAYPNIRLLVGAHRAGIGYGIFGVLGGGINVVVPILAGKIFDAEANSEGTSMGANVCYYFAGLAGLATLLWGLVHCLEGRKSAIELPASKLIESSGKHIEAAGLTDVVGSDSSDSEHERGGGGGDKSDSSDDDGQLELSVAKRGKAAEREGAMA